jgi:hypothetical protein
MNKVFPSWAPEILIDLYKFEAYKLENNEYSQKAKEVQSKKIDAFYRLGTYEEMKDVWTKLLTREAMMISYPIDINIALVDGIHRQIWLNPLGEKQLTPKDKDEQLGEVGKAIKSLQRAIKRVGEATFENPLIIENLLHKRNMEYRNHRGERVEMPANPLYLKFIERNANAELSQLSLDEHMPWKDRTQAQCLGWWTREAISLNLTDILEYYSEKMNFYSRNYRDHYAKDTSRLCRGLSWLMNELYGKDLDDFVARIMNVILDVDSWDKDKVRKNRSYKRAK